MSRRLRFDPYTIVVPYYHPDYGLTYGTRLAAMRLVIVDGHSVKEAASLSNIHPSTLYKWLAYSTIQKDL